MPYSRRGGESKLLTQDTRSPRRNPRWTKDGKSIMALVDDDRQTYLAAFSTHRWQNDQSSARWSPCILSLAEPVSGDSWLTTISDTAAAHDEIYALKTKTPRRLTHHTDSIPGPPFPGVRRRLSRPKAVTAHWSPDCSSPAGYSNRRQKLPLILFIHGGPVGQDDFDFDLSRQMLTAGGYAVAAVNYRGSSGRGLDYCKVISADWGNKEVIDLHGAVDYLVKKGIADPE